MRFIVVCQPIFCHYVSGAHYVKILKNICIILFFFRNLDNAYTHNGKLSEDQSAALILLHDHTVIVDCVMCCYYKRIAYTGITCKKLYKDKNNQKAGAL